MIFDHCEVRRSMASRPHVFSASEAHSLKEHVESLRPMRNYTGSQFPCNVIQSARVETRCACPNCRGVFLALPSSAEVPCRHLWTAQRGAHQHSEGSIQHLKFCIRNLSNCPSHAVLDGRGVHCGIVFASTVKSPVRLAAL